MYTMIPIMIIMKEIVITMLQTVKDIGFMVPMEVVMVTISIRIAGMIIMTITNMEATMMIHIGVVVMFMVIYHYALDMMMVTGLMIVTVVEVRVSA